MQDDHVRIAIIRSLAMIGRRHDFGHQDAVGFEREQRGGHGGTIASQTPEREGEMPTEVKTAAPKNLLITLPHEANEFSALVRGPKRS
jgi:hypothetical protein